MVVDIARLVPRFLLEDRNGYAMAKAIEAGLQRLTGLVQDGIDCVLDVSTMPEWRLDEMAWELNCPYDYSADVSQKRLWIENAVPYFYAFGTRQAILNYLSAYGATVDENWVYGGDPFHFKVTVNSDVTQHERDWIRNAIETTKNVRSVLDELGVGSGTKLVFRGDTTYYPDNHRMAGTTLWADEIPESDPLT